MLTKFLNTGFNWLCKKREHHSPNNDVWDLRYHWQKRRHEIQQKLELQSYQFSPLQQYRFAEETLALYNSTDALVLKTISLSLNEQLKREQSLSPHCYHVKNQGGLKSAVNKTEENLKHYRFVFKSDIKGYYEHIDHEALCNEVFELTQDPIITSLIEQSLKVPSTWGGLYYERKRGIPRASPLSPLLGAIALNPLDKAMTKIKGVFYARFMDDWVVLCKTRYQLRKVIKITYEILNKLKLSLHPDKTYVGKISNGFDFLGFRFGGESLSVAKETYERAMSKYQQLYEQGASMGRLVDYWRRFLQWVSSIVGDTEGKNTNSGDVTPFNRGSGLGFIPSFAWLNGRVNWLGLWPSGQLRAPLLSGPDATRPGSAPSYDSCELVSTAAD